MSTENKKFIKLISGYKEHDEDSYYINPVIIKMVIADELKMNMSYLEIEKFINSADIMITAEQIEEFLNNKMNEEQPGLKEKLENEINNSSSIITFTGNEEDVKKRITASIEKMGDMATASTYYFEPYSLQYFKTYVSILKQKCQELFNILHELENNKLSKPSDNYSQMILDLDFHVNKDGNLNITDADRLVNAIVYNVRDLYDKVSKGNNCETYLTFKLSEHELLKEGILDSEIYPRKEVQIKSLHYAYNKEFIELSKNQKKQLENDSLDSMSKWIKDTNEDTSSNPVLKKTII